jgi:mycofactocin system glycosyltransferase
MTVPVPEGWRVRLDPRTQVLDGGRTLLTPTGRLLRLGPGAPVAMAALARGTADLRGRQLGRALLDAGAGHPEPPGQVLDDVTVVVPVRDRLDSLRACLEALKGVDVLVVDDGSQSPDAVSALCESFGARCTRRDNGGPAAARNSALPLLGREFVAFVDSDCIVTPAALVRLRGHLEDPAVGAAAPRVAGDRRSPLDLGTRPAGVRPGGAVSYVPTACLMVRLSALSTFDEGLRYGEDVDLVWRMSDAGWELRYDPSIEVTHAEPDTVGGRLRRRFHYGTSAAPLAARHPDRLAHVVLPPWPTAVVALLLLRRPWLALAAAGAATRRVDATVHRPATSAVLVARAVVSTGTGLGRALALTGPVGWWAATRNRGAALLLVAPLLHEWRSRRPRDSASSYVGSALLEEAAYGAGVVAGCARHRTLRPLLPRFTKTG